MTSAAPTFPPLGHASLRIPPAAFEVLAYLTVVASATLAFVAGWLTVNAAVVITVILLSSLIVLSWTHLGQGRHPCFLFMCTLMLFQGGRLLAYCLGVEPEPMKVVLLASSFNLSRFEEGTTLFCVASSAICIYAVCRWRYQSIPPPDASPVSRFLPYLYLVYFCSLPLQLLKNYLYLKYVQENGGYLVFFTNYAGLTASVPPIVRVLALVTFPVFIALFVFETRRGRLWLITTLYFASAALFLLTGSRMETFSVILTLWYVSRIKRANGSRLLMVATAATLLVLLSNAIQAIRFDETDELTNAVPRLALFIKEQGISLNVTEVSIRYRGVFAPYVSQYALREVMSKFVSSDVTNYRRGQQFSLDIPLFLNRGLFERGIGTGGAYLAQGYIVGGVTGVVIISLLIGMGLRLLHTLGRRAATLFFVALVLPDILMLPRGGVLVWFSTTIRTALVALAVIGGWFVYSFIASIGRTPPSRPGLPVSA